MDGTKKGAVVAGIARVGVVVVVSALVAPGCGRAASREVAANAHVSDAPLERAGAVVAATAPAPESHVVGESVRIGSGSVAVEAMEAGVQAGRLFNPPPGRQYYAIAVRGCSGRQEDGLEFRPEYFSLRLEDHSVYEAGPGIKKFALSGGTVPAGGCLEGWVTFVIPEDGQPAWVVYDGSQPVRWAVPPPPKSKPAR